MRVDEPRHQIPTAKINHLSLEGGDPRAVVLEHASDAFTLNEDVHIPASRGA